MLFSERHRIWFSLAFSWPIQIVYASKSLYWLRGFISVRDVEMAFSYKNRSIEPSLSEEERDE